MAQQTITSQNRTERQITIDIDVLIAIIGALAGLEVTVWLAVAGNNRLQPIFALLVFVACVGYLLAKKKAQHMELSELITERRQRASVYLLLNISFFVLVTSSLMSVALRPELYTRPLAYFVCIALASAVLATEIFLLPPGKSHAAIMVVKIVILALVLVLTSQAVFPSLLGMDTFTHGGITDGIVADSHLPEVQYGVNPSSGDFSPAEVYRSFPVMHLFGASTMLVANVDYRVATMVSTCFVYIVISILFMFLLGRFVYSAKVGLLAALLLGCAAFFIHFGWWMIPNGVGAMLALPTIYLVFSSRSRRSQRLMALAVILMGTLILTHTIAPLAFAIVMLVFWLGHLLYTKVYQVKLRAPAPLSLSILFTMAMFAWWVYASPYAVDAIIKLVGHEPVVEPGPVDPAIKYMESVPYGEYLLRNVSYPLLWALSFVGCLAACSRRFGNEYIFILGLGGVFLLSMGFVAEPLGFTVIPERWQLESIFLLALPAGFGLLFLLHNLLGDDSKRILTLSLLVVALSFISVVSPIANTDNPELARNTSVRYAFKASELRAGTTISSTWGSEVSTDTYYYSAGFFSSDTFEEGVKSLTYNFSEKDFGDVQGTAVIRTEVAERPFHLPGVYKLNYDPRQVMSTSADGFSQVYDCGTVSAFVRKYKVKDQIDHPAGDI